MKLGVEKTAMIRVRAGISYALTEAMDDGHCGLPIVDLVPLAESLLEVGADSHPHGARFRTCRGHGDCRQPRRHGLHLSGEPLPSRAGHCSATACALPVANCHGTRLTPTRRCLDRTPDQPRNWHQARKRLSASQSRPKVLVITGGPGVGKTTIVNAILRILAAKTVKLLLCARPGRAAKRLNETTGTGCQDHSSPAGG